MQIVLDSKRVLEAIYELLSDDSYALVVQVPMKTMSESLNMSPKHLTLCIHYLIECGYLKGDFAYNSNELATKDVTITPSTINKLENASI